MNIFVKNTLVIVLATYMGASLGAFIAVVVTLGRTLA